MTQEKLSHFFETLDEHTSIETYKTIYYDAVVFKDPFNKVEGIHAVYDIFAHMYKDLDTPKFVITEYLGTQHTAYVKWDFIFAFKGEKRENRFEGVSRLEINADDKITSHTDYWDAAEHLYEKMPLVGFLLRLIKRKISKSKTR